MSSRRARSKSSNSIKSKGDSSSVELWFVSGDGEDFGEQEEINPNDLVFWSKNSVLWQTAWSKDLQRRSADEKKLQREIYQKISDNGIPNILRSEIWPTIATESEYELMKLQEEYMRLRGKKSSWQSEIAADITRTFPGHPKFAKGDEAQMELLRILTAYSLFDPELGYSQGTNFIAATIVLMMPEERAFAVFASLMKRFNLRFLYLNECEGLKRQLHFLSETVRVKSSKLKAHLDDQMIEPGMYATQWLLSCFTSRFPLAFSKRVLDLLLLKPEDTQELLMKLTTSMLLYHRSEIFECEVDDFMDYFRSVLPAHFAIRTLPEEGDGPSYYEHSEKFLRFAMSFRLERWRKIIIEHSWHQQRSKCKRAATNKDELIKELSEKNEALMVENEDLRIKNSNLKSQLDEICGRWTEIALKE